MKRIQTILLTAALLLTAGTVRITAQTQKGYVKTRGYLDRNGTVVKGTRLSGATVIVKGRSTVLSGKDGGFSVAIPGTSYYLQSVHKQGYVLTDPEMLLKQYAYSSDPLVIVLETPEKQLRYKLDAMTRISATLQEQLTKSYAEIQTLKEQNKLSQEEYQQRMQEVILMQGNNQQLVTEMAEF